MTRWKKLKENNCLLGMFFYVQQNENIFTLIFSAAYTLDNNISVTTSQKKLKCL